MNGNRIAIVTWAHTHYLSPVLYLLCTKRAMLIIFAFLFSCHVFCVIFSLLPFITIPRVVSMLSFLPFEQLQLFLHILLGCTKTLPLLLFARYHFVFTVVNQFIQMCSTQKIANEQHITHFETPTNCNLLKYNYYALYTYLIWMQVWNLHMWYVRVSNIQNWRKKVN